MTLSIMINTTLGMKTLSIMTFSITIRDMIEDKNTIQHIDTQNYDTRHNNKKPAITIKTLSITIKDTILNITASSIPIKA